MDGFVNFSMKLRQISFVFGDGLMFSPTTFLIGKLIASLHQLSAVLMTMFVLVLMLCYGFFNSRSETLSICWFSRAISAQLTGSYLVNEIQITMLELFKLQQSNI